MGGGEGVCGCGRWGFALVREDPRLASRLGRDPGKEPQGEVGAPSALLRLGGNTPYAPLSPTTLPVSATRPCGAPRHSPHGGGWAPPPGPIRRRVAARCACPRLSDPSRGSGGRSRPSPFRDPGQPFNVSRPPGPGPGASIMPRGGARPPGPGSIGPDNAFNNSPSRARQPSGASCPSCPRSSCPSCPKNPGGLICPDWESY